MRTRVPYYINNMLINIFTWFLFYSLSLIAASLKFTFHFSHFHLLHCITFQIHIHFHIFTSEVTCYFCYFCYFCYRLTILLPFYPFTFLPLNALLPLNCVPTQPFLRRDVSGTASGRSHRYVVTQFRAHRQGGKKHQNAGCNPERRTFRFVKYLSIVYGIVNFLPVCASTV